MEAQEIGGRYSVIERIGKGAMGVVFKAYDPVLDRVVAIKKMVQEIGQDEELRQRFYVEARAAARLNHRNIVTIHELEESDGEIYIVMEYLEGVDLSSVIKRKVPLPIEAKLSIVGQLCEGLDYAHRHGIVHRDIKPGNMHLSPGGVVKILDFGIARLASSKMTGTGALLGTPDYMSPEQVMGEDIDARSDLFAVGGVLYELLAGAKAFESDTVASLLIKIAKNPHVPITNRMADLPVSLVSLVNRLLAKDRDQRPPTAGAVVAELKACAMSITGGSDTAVSALIGGIVTEQTLAIRSTASPMQGQPSAGTPRPPQGKATAPRDLARAAAPPAATKRADAPPQTPQQTAAESSNARLASLALQRGRELRKNGDLAGAIQVFRSVLEVAPGNPEALDELQALESDIRQATASRQPKPDEQPSHAAETILKPRDLPAPPAPAVVSSPVAAAAPATATPAPSPAPVAAAQTPKGKSGAGLAVAATLLVVAIGASGGGYYLWTQRTANSGSSPSVAQSGTNATPPASSSVPAPPPTSAPPTAAADSTAPAATPATGAAAPAAPASDAKPAAADGERTRAEASRQRLGELKQERAASNAPPLPVRLRNEAIRFEREGTQAFEGSEFARASVLFDEAGRIVAMRPDGRGRGMAGAPAGPADPAPAPASPATATAQATRPADPRPVESRPPNQPARPTPPQAPARTEDPAPVRIQPQQRESSPGDISTFNRSAPSTVDQMFNATPSTAASVARIKDLLERYAKAIEQRDLENLRTYRADPAPIELQLIRQGKQVSYKLDDVAVQSNGQEGVATARRTISAELESGEKITRSGQITLRLTRRPTGWVITDIK